MKKTKFKTVILLLIILFSAQITFAQEEEKKDSKKAVFGLGVSLFNVSNVASNNSFYFVFNIGNKIRLEPSIGLFFDENSREYNQGIGLFGKKTMSKFNLLYGLRFNIGLKQRTNTIFNNTDITYEVSPTIGGEYAFIKNFSLGAEVKLSALNANDRWVSYTNSSVLIRFYF